jgi:hypothetical protein
MAMVIRQVEKYNYYVCGDGHLSLKNTYSNLDLPKWVMNALKNAITRSIVMDDHIMQKPCV